MTPDSIRLRVLDYIAMHPRSTTQDIAEATGLHHIQVKAACTRLQQEGWIDNVAMSGNGRPRTLVRRERA